MAGGSLLSKPITNGKHSGHHGSDSVNSVFNSLNQAGNQAPLTERQYLAFLDGEGRVRCPRELRIATFRRGIEPGLR